jgi:hypothetical protein
MPMIFLANSARLADWYGRVSSGEKLLCASPCHISHPTIRAGSSILSRGPRTAIVDHQPPRTILCHPLLCHAVRERSGPLTPMLDLILWIRLYRIWRRCQNFVLLVKPATVVRVAPSRLPALWTLAIKG